MRIVYSNEPSPFKSDKPSTLETLRLKNQFTKGEWFIVNWQYREGEEFGALLAETMAKADTKNLKAFSLGFPEEAEAMWKYKTEKGWWQGVSKRYCDMKGLMKEITKQTTEPTR